MRKLLEIVNMVLQIIVGILFVLLYYKLALLTMKEEKKTTKEKEEKVFSVTGTFHGSIIVAETEGEARRIFHTAWKGETITHMRDITKANLSNL